MRFAMFSGLAGVAAGALGAYIAIGWVVLASNGVRDQAINGAAAAMKKCSPQVTAPAPAKRPPRHWKL